MKQHILTTVVVSFMMLGGIASTVQADSAVKDGPIGIVVGAGEVQDIAKEGVAIGGHNAGGKDSYKTIVSGENGIAIAATGNKVTGANAIAVGNSAEAKGDKSIAIGANARIIKVDEKTSANYSIAIGTEASTHHEGNISIGKGAETTTNNSMAIGTKAYANGAGAIALGAGSHSNASSITIGQDSQGTDKGVVIGTRANGGLGEGNTIVGSEAEGRAKGATAYGYQAKSQKAYDLSVGYNSEASGGSSVAVGSRSKVASQWAIAIGANSVVEKSALNTVVLGSNINKVKNANNVILGSSSADADIKPVKESVVINEVTYSDFAGVAKGVVSVGSVGKERQIQNVSAGDISKASTDAINGSQLFAVAEKVSTNVGNIKLATDTADEAKKLAKETADQLGTLTSTTSQNLDVVTRLTHEAHQEAVKVGAKSAALSGLHPLSFDKTQKFNVAVAGGAYRNEQALALGGFYAPNQDVLVSFATTVGGSDNMYSIGASFRVGDKGATPTVYKNIPEVVAQQSEMIRVQQEQINRLIEQVESLQRRK